MKQVLKSLLCFVLILAMSVPVFAANSTDKGLSDEPYDYGLVPFSEEWDKLSTIERKEIFTIPEEVAKGLTTRALLETILNNPYFCDIFAYDSVEIGIERKEFRFQFNNLFAREDIVNVLLNEVENYLPINYLEILDGLNSLDREIQQEYIRLVYCLSLLNIVESFSSNQLNLNNIFNGYSINATAGTVQTIGGLSVECLYDCTWLNHGVLAEMQASASELAYGNTYSDNILLSVKSPLYNCHSYAWHFASTNSHVWIKSSKAWPYLQDLNCYVVGQAIADEKVVYFTDNDTVMDHSGIIYSVSGGNIYVVSKWGTCGLYYHLLNDCPYAETASSIHYYIYAVQ